MLTYVYDGTPMGLATAAAAALDLGGGEKAGTAVSLVAAECYRPNLFDESRRIEADYIVALDFWRELAARLPADL